MFEFPVVDTHVHLWDPARLEYAWHAHEPQLNRPFLLSDFRDATQGVDIQAMVFLQCDCNPAQGLDEARWVAELANSDPRLKAMVPYAPIEQGDACSAYLEQLQAVPLVRGVRRLIQSERDPAFCLQPKFIEGLKLLPEFRLSFEICIYHHQLTSVLKLVEKLPEVSFVLDHIGKPNIKHGILQPWSAQMRSLSEFPNVVCKVSGMVTEADHEGWNKEQLKPYLDHVVACFGWDRLLYGGDWPVVNLAGGYRRWLEALNWALDGASSEERRKFYCENAARVYRF